MADRTTARPALIWIVVTLLVAAYAGWLTMQTDRLREQTQAAHARERALVEQVQRLAFTGRGAAPAAATQSSPPETLVRQLLRRPDLIPLQPVLGGTFYFLEDSVVQLSDRYVYATVEDGHVRGHLLLRIVDGADGLSFEVIDAYHE